jgi:very-short-patch-repair endonuclease
MKHKTRAQPERGEVLVAIMNNKADFAILQEQNWYRIPVATAPRRWPPRWLAFYQTKVFGDEAYTVNYYGRVRDIRVVRRCELFPDEFPNPKSDRRYYQISLKSLERLPHPIYSRRWRRIVFIPTTLEKFTRAVEINDLFDASPLEDRLWAELKRLKIAAERQWDLKVGGAWYFLDFAVFCANGRIDIETDGDTWHADPKRIPEDNRRDNALQSVGWRVLRFNGCQIRESLTAYCIPKITDTINSLDGLSDEGLVPRVFYQLPDGMAQQLSLFEQDTDYE